MILARRFGTTLGLFCCCLASPSLAGELKGRLVAGNRPAEGVVISAVPYESPADEARREARAGAPPAALSSTRTAPDGRFAISVSDAGLDFRLKAENGKGPDGATKQLYLSLDSDGRGEIPSLSPGTYQVALQRTGCAPIFLESVAVPLPALSVAVAPGGSGEIHAGPRTLAKGTARLTLSASGQPYR